MLLAAQRVKESAEFGQRSGVRKKVNAVGIVQLIQDSRAAGVEQCFRAF